MKKILNWFIGEIKFERQMIRSYRITITQRKEIAYADFNNLKDLIDFLNEITAEDLPEYLKKQVKEIYKMQIRKNIRLWQAEDESEIITIKELQQKYSKKA